MNYIFVNWACNAAGMLPVYLLTAGALIVAALGTWTSWRNWKSAGAEQTFELGGPIGRSRFIAFVGMMFSGLFFIGILAMAVPTWIMDACHP
ncbi:MAG: hypothetical protein M1436_10740 [Acidobacteria bacterium]|nr:hypothetical protein [Acidobacteriota bacterium]